MTLTLISEDVINNRRQRSPDGCAANNDVLEFCSVPPKGVAH